MPHSACMSAFHAAWVSDHGGEGRGREEGESMKVRRVGAGGGFSLTFNTQPATPPAEFQAGAVGASGCKGVGDDGNAEMAAAWRR